MPSLLLTLSGIPPISETITGFPNAFASSKTIQYTSHQIDGTTTASTSCIRYASVVCRYGPLSITTPVFQARDLTKSSSYFR